MPLHLLGKKSWNVYNQTNIDRVRRDEAAAKAKEEAEEELMQEEDARRRLKILRGETPSPPPAVSESEKPQVTLHKESFGRERKKRKRFGENDTDYELRLAVEAQSSSTPNQLVHSQIDAPLVDSSGHIDLFPQQALAERGKDAVAEKDAARKKREEEQDTLTMRFSNAAGFKQSLSTPWYSKGSEKVSEDIEPLNKDVWGNDDVTRQQREAARVVSSDPLLAMRQGAAKVRQIKKDREKLQEERRQAIRDLERDQERRKRTKHHRDDDDLEGFSLDTDASSRHDRERRRRHHRHRSHEHSRGREDRSKIRKYSSHRHRESHRSHRNRSKDRGRDHNAER